MNEAIVNGYQTGRGHKSAGQERRMLKGPWGYGSVKARSAAAYVLDSYP